MSRGFILSICLAIAKLGETGKLTNNMNLNTVEASVSGHPQEAELELVAYRNV